MRDLIFKRLLSICCILILLISAGMIYSLVSGSIPALSHYGFFQFIGSTEWDPHPDRETYGALSFIVGTLLTSFLALIFCIPFSLPVALFTGEFFRGKKIATFISSIIDLLAGIPRSCTDYGDFIPSARSSSRWGSIHKDSEYWPHPLFWQSWSSPMHPPSAASSYPWFPTNWKRLHIVWEPPATMWSEQSLFPPAGSGVFASYILALGTGSWKNHGSNHAYRQHE